MAAVFARLVTAALAVLPVIIALLLQSCGGKPFNEEKPYAVLVDKYRGYTEAKEAAERIERMGAQPYIICKQNNLEGKWYLVMLGQVETLEEMMAQKIDYEDKYRIQELEIVNFKRYSSDLVAFEPDEVVPDELAPLEPEMEPDMEEIIKRLPCSSTFQPARITLFHPPAKGNLLDLSTVRQKEIDIPRGLAPSTLFRAAKSLGEVVYRDRITGQGATVHAVKLANEHEFGRQVAKYFAETIVGTREYKVEEVKEIKVDAYETLRGYLIEIVPKGELIYRYAVLCDDVQQYVFFVQTTSMRADELLAFAESFGNREGLEGYQAFRQNFFMLPPKKMPKDRLCYYRQQQMRQYSGRQASRLTGATMSHFVFQHTEKGFWEAHLTQLHEPANVEDLYDRTDREQKKIRRDAIQVKDRKGWMTYARRKKKDGTMADIPEELYFGTNTHLVCFSNEGRALLSREELLNRAQLFQLHESQRGEKRWYHF